MRTLSQILKRYLLSSLKTAAILRGIFAAAIISFFFFLNMAALCEDGAAHAFKADEDRATQGWDSSALAGYTAGRPGGLLINLAAVSFVTPSVGQFGLFLSLITERPQGVTL